MRVLRGRAASIDADREVTAEMLSAVGEDGDAAVRVWTPHRQVAFGRRDAREDGYEAAREAASDRGFPPVERSVGGRAVAYAGTTLAFALAEPIDDLREGLDERYERATTAVERALREVGVETERGEPDDSFCPGTHSLQRDGKIVGIAQRVRQDAALTAGVAIVDARDEIAAVLDDVYDALGVPFDPDSVGSVATAGGTGDPEAVQRAIERAFVGDADAAVERVD
ncbi:lipoate--protein ligase family protein [Halostella sp. JP-L12]|uniref:lipoate--protein ligase family protein n=1 Tax=Halostella TaxID=1843185 RepID=UPI000EF7CB09|nr:MULTISPECIES: lipoate--protein ligase family protein [Halostella]NHN48331.1 lipoate--protein ligase family protein [Halostella sp. JP-L12]